MHPDAVRETDRASHGGAEDPACLDFSANTNPRRPPGVDRVYDTSLDTAGRYPSDEYAEFRRVAAEYVDCRADHVVPTAGGTGAIRLAIETTVEPDDRVLVPYPSFGEYAREVGLQGASPVFVPHDAMLDADPSGCALAIVCTPNNPTGGVYDPDRLRAFATRCREAGTPLLVDEAFLDFTIQPSLAGESGVIVARSLTKIFGLPGLRMGFAAATGDLRDALENARAAWNLSRPAEAVGTHCLRQTAFVEETRTRVQRERDRMREALSSTYEVSNSDAPFLLLRTVDRNPGTVVAAARQTGIAVRDATTFRGLDSHVRVAVRLPDENDRLLEVLLDG